MGEAIIYGRGHIAEGIEGENVAADQRHTGER